MTFIEWYFRLKIYGFIILPVIFLVLFGIWLFQRVRDAQKNKGIIAVGLKKSPLYVRVDKVYELNIEEALKQMNNDISIYNCKRLFGNSPTSRVYLCGSSPEKVGIEDPSYKLQVISAEGLEQGKQGIDLDSPRMHMLVSAFAIKLKK